MSIKWRIHLENCANISKGEVEVESGKINLKFGHNGIGKTTILKSLEVAISNSSKRSELIPYNTQLIPDIKGVSDFKNIIVFNEDYINQFLFDSNDLLKNSHQLLVTTTPNFKETEEEIKKLLLDMQKSISSNKELTLQIAELEKFESSLIRKNDGTLDGKCRFMKGFKEGNKLSNIPEESVVYKNLVMDSNWIVWFKGGRIFQESLNNNSCPYCGSDLNQSILKRINITDKNYDKIQIQHLSTSLKTISEIELLMREKDLKEVRKITSTTEVLTKDQQIYMVGLKQDANTLIHKLKTIRDLNYHYFKNIELNNLENELSELLINPTFYNSFDSKFLQRISLSINETIEKTIKNIAPIKRKIGEHNALIKKTIEKYENDINEFLDYAGFKYYVKMVENNEVYNLILYPSESNQGLNNVSTHLSYGEKNVFAIALFLYQAIDSKYDLVVLDDPISSFDKNKKFAILHKLFKGDLSLNNRTVLLATHDFDTVIDLCYVKNRGYNVSAKYLTNNNGVLFEKDISKDKIKSFFQISKDNMNSTNELIIQLIYARRVLDVTRYSNVEENLAWNYISSILHLKECPDIQAKEGESTIVMSQSQIEQSERYILNRFNIRVLTYNGTVDSLNKEYLLRIYSETNSNYTKLHVYRVILELLDEKKPKEKSRESIFNKFINETYHPENDYIFDLNPIEFERIPNYIIEKCDRYIESIKIR